MSEPQTSLERASERPLAPTPKYKRLQETQLRELLSLRRLGKTQVEIAQAIGCDQRTVSRWLETFQDSRDDATAYLRGNALKMAINIVKKGKPREHVDALKGLSVLEQSAQDPRIQVVVGVSLPGLPSQERTVTATLSPSLSEGLSPVSE